MRVDDDVGAHTIDGERHVTFGDDVTYGTLLPVTRREFVTDNRFAGSADADFCDTISVAVAVDEVLVDVGFLGSAMNFAVVFVFDELRVVVAVLLDGDNLCDNDVAIFDKCIFRYETLVIDLVVVAEFHALCL